jgi:hypothetical protein
MLTQPTIEKLQALHLTAMAQAFDQQRGSAAHAELHFEDRFGLLVDAEWTPASSGASPNACATPGCATRRRSRTSISRRRAASRATWS